MSSEGRKPLETAEEESRFYIIFDELAKAEQEYAGQANAEELDDIEQVRRMVMDVTEEPPVFMTST